MTTLAASNGYPLPAFKLGASQDVAIGAASTASTAFAGGTKVIRVIATSACRIKIAVAPTALATSTYLTPGVPEVFQVASGETLAVIQVAAAGTLNITELA